MVDDSAAWFATGCRIGYIVYWNSSLMAKGIGVVLEGPLATPLESGFGLVFVCDCVAEVLDEEKDNCPYLFARKGVSAGF